MIHFLAPGFLYAAAAVAAATVALHFLVRRQPRSGDLPTTRFVPEGAVETVTTARRPQDLLTLLVRVAMILLAGTAFARPVLTPERRAVLRIVVADVSRSVASLAEVGDSVRALVGHGDALVVFDSTARLVGSSGVDTLDWITPAGRPGRLSPALVVAMRAATALRAGADSIELAIVSPLASSEVDAATAQLRALWPGRIRIVPVAADSIAPTPAGGVVVRAAGDDVVLLAATAAGIVDADGPVRVTRDPADADTGWAASPGRTLVRWPADGAPPGWEARASVDTVGAVVAMAGATVVAPLERRWQRAPGAPPARVVARWVDGEPAAVERTVGGGCVRDVSIAVPERGDLILRPQFARLLVALTRPCDSLAPTAPLGAAERSALAGSGPLAASAAIPAPDVEVTPLVAWLMAAALLLALVELWVRRGGRPSPAASTTGSSTAGSSGSGERAPPPRASTDEDAA